MSSGSSEPTPSKSEELYLQQEQLAETQAAVTESHDVDDALAGLAIGANLHHEDKRLNEFLNSSEPAQAIEMWLGRPLNVAKDDKEELARKLNRDVASIDNLLQKQLNAVLHHPKFQKLESAWRGLQMLHQSLVDETMNQDASHEVLLRILDVSWQELHDDFDKAGYVEQSRIFDKVYEKEFGTLGGDPFGLLIGDYEIDPQNNEHLFVMENMAAVAASAFSPFVTNVSPAMFDLDDFSQLDEISDLSLHDDVKNVRWNRLVAKEDARFLGLCMPRILMRCPYQARPEFGLAVSQHRSRKNGSSSNEFCFQEDVKGPDSSKYLWGGACYSYASVVMRSFGRTGWLADIRGVERGRDGGGLVSGLPVEYYPADRGRVIPKPATDGIVTDALEKELSNMGLIPLCSIYGSSQHAFYSGSSIQKPPKYDNELANVNARLSSMLHNMLCVSRFAHYLKDIGRKNIGRFDDPNEIENELENWISGYVMELANATLKEKAEYPLFKAKVQVRDVPGKSGVYVALFDLQPHYEIEGLTAGIRLKTELKV